MFVRCFVIPRRKWTLSKALNPRQPSVLFFLGRHTKHVYFIYGCVVTEFVWWLVTKKIPAANIPKWEQMWTVFNETIKVLEFETYFGCGGQLLLLLLLSLLLVVSFQLQEKVRQALDDQVRTNNTLRHWAEKIRQSSPETQTTQSKVTATPLVFGPCSSWPNQISQEI